MKKVFVQLESGRGYGRDLLKGIHEYNNQFSNWEIVFEPAYYLKTSQKNDISKLIKLMKPDGCILENIDNMSMITKLGVPFIRANSLDHIEESPYLKGNYESDGKVAVDYFLSLGFKRLAFFGVKDLAWSDGRYASFKNHAQLNGIEVSHYLAENTSKKGLRHDFEGIIAWLKSLPKPIGILCCNDDFGQMLINACSLSHLKIPYEIAILGIDNDELLCNMTHPKLSSIARNHRKAAFNACKILDRMMNDEFIEDYIIPTEPLDVVERTSTDIIACNDTEVIKALHYIRNNTHLNLTVTNVVEVTNISRRSLYTRFKTVTKNTIYDEIQLQKLKKFKTLLRNQNLSVKEIAFSLGFDDASHISRWFSSIEGIPPIKWRNENI
ncbi:DNA-binding transcriptional regulator [Mariniflexile litorale]|uniref:DNA-binding transcriptional regulator n=1 Tax=Mariniflexile litorale TaxID=3045158 RepID=A0AAU7EI64_9FLAO|nr:DNA-binding transcriptional regulator [Mariniflexile sp. KMM 9835]MDQ8210855.1 DNA-binding transcriptional regulator [Mariniflexile sp. KMM 9835]